MDKNGKSRHSVWLSDEVWQEVDALYKLDNCPTRNEFVEKALRQYCGRLHAERTSAYLPHALQEMLEGTLGVFGDRLGKLLFKLVVEHNMTNHLLGGDIPTIVLHPEQKMIHQLCIFIIVTESAITSEQEPLVDPHKTDR